MKKYLLLIGIIISICFYTTAERREVSIKHYDTTSPNITKPHRSIKVYYNDDTRKIEFSCDEDDLIGSIYLLDNAGQILDFSHSFSEGLEAPIAYSGIITIRIEGDDWVAIGTIQI